jgi:hypothetical protein
MQNWEDMNKHFHLPHRDKAFWRQMSSDSHILALKEFYQKWGRNQMPKKLILALYLKIKKNLINQEKFLWKNKTNTDWNIFMYRTNSLLAYKVKILKFRSHRVIFRKKLARIMILNIIVNKFFRKLITNWNQLIMTMKESCKHKNHFYKSQSRTK